MPAVGPLVGALIFPVGLLIIVLLGLELVTGSFALAPLARLEGRFLIPTGMLLGAKISFYDWRVWNQIPVTLGNLVGGAAIALLFWYVHRYRAE